MTPSMFPSSCASLASSLLLSPKIHSGRALTSSPLLNSSTAPSWPNHCLARSAVARSPAAILTLQFVALILTFVSMTAELLVDRQADAIAVLRSRGASGRQIFGSLSTQAVLLSL